MNICLISSDACIQDYHKPFLKKFSRKKKVARALFVTCAAVPFGIKPKPPFLKKSLAVVCELAETVDETSLEDKDAIPSDLSIYDFIFVSGGSTFYLNAKLHTSGFGEKIKNYIHTGGRYIGSSAGALVLLKNISHIALADEPKKAPFVKNEGLGVLDFVVLPHGDNKQFKDQIRAVKKLYQQDKSEVIVLNDNQILFFDGKTKKII